MDSNNSDYVPDRDFHKVFLSNFANAIGPVGNKQTEVVLWILRHLTPGNELAYSYRQIAKGSGVSYQTVVRTMKVLLEKNFLRRNGKVLVVNPDIIYKGRSSGRWAAREKYEHIEVYDERYVRKLRGEIKRLTLEADKLDEELAKGRMVQWKMSGITDWGSPEARLMETETRLRQIEADMKKLGREKEALKARAEEYRKEVEEKKRKEAEAAQPLPEAERTEAEDELLQVQKEMRRLKAQQKKLKGKIKEDDRKKKAAKEAGGDSSSSREG